MRHILFVDEEPFVLQALRDVIHPRRREWSGSFARTPEEAIRLLDAEPYDMVVCDLRMPRVDGATLLHYVQETQPGAVRIVLSSAGESAAALRSVPVAHQFLAKPCNSIAVCSVLQEAFDLRDVLNDPELLTRVGGIGALPPVPRIYAELTKLLATPTASARQVSRLLEEDVALSAKLLQVVNSAFFGVRRRVASMSDAVAYLGLNLVKDIVLTVEAFRVLEGVRTLPGFDVEAVARSGMLTGRIARRLVSERHEQPDAFMAGTLHDVGLLVMATREPDALGDILTTARARKVSAVTVERERSSVTHAEIGAYLLGLWGIPYGIVAAVAHHHTPQRTHPSRLGVVEAVSFAASLAAHALTPALPGNDLDEVLLKQIGLESRAPAWQAIAEEEHWGLGA